MPLSAQRRQQLDDIVTKLADQDAPQEDVQSIVDDFKSKYGNESDAQAPAAPSFGKKLATAILPDLNTATPDSTREMTMQKDPMTGAFSPVATGRMRPATGLEKGLSKAGQLAGNVLDASQRAGFQAANIGAAMDPNAPDFLTRMAEDKTASNVDAGIDKTGLPGPVKFAGKMAVGSVDPLTPLVGGISAFKALKANRAAVSGLGAAVDVSEDVAKASALTGGRAGKASKTISGIPLSKGQVAALSGVPVDANIERLARTEAQLQAQKPEIWDAMVKDQEGTIDKRVQAIQDKRGFTQEDPGVLHKNIVESILEDHAARDANLKINYNSIEKKANSSPLLTGDSYTSAIKALDDMGFYPTRLVEADGDAGRMVAVPVFSKKKLVPGTHTVEGAVGKTETYTEKAAPHQSFERPVVDANGEQMMQPKDFNYPTNREVSVKSKLSNGDHSQDFADAVTAARRDIYDHPSYSTLKDARGRVGSVIGDIRRNGTGASGYGYKDMTAAQEIYGKLSDAMAEHLHSVDGLDAVNKWHVQDAIFSKKESFNKLRSILKPTDAGFVDAESGVQRLIGRNNSESFQALSSVRDLEQSGVLQSGTFQKLQNATFNNLVQKATVKRGARQVVDGERLLAAVKDIPAPQYNVLFSGGLEDDMAQLILESTAQKLAQKAKIATMPENAIMAAAKSVGGNPFIWAWRLSGKKALSGALLSKVLGGMAGRLSARDATNYIRQVDNKSLWGAFFKGSAKTGGALGASRALANPGQDQPTASQEDQGL